jgi:hydroxymethylbilane synthase
MSSRTFRLGTRGSPLALWQAEWVRQALLSADAALEPEIVVIKTSAENFPEQEIPLIGTGVFSREIDEALLAGELDAAIHSLKDLPSDYHPDLEIIAIPPRESPLDAFVSASGENLSELGAGARIGTGSPRRKAQLLSWRSDLEVVPLRGNVNTRLEKIAREGLAGTILAHAGLKRLGKEELITELVDTSVILPAVGQGALALVCRKNDDRFREQLIALDDQPGHEAILAERSFLRRLRGGCQVAAGALARIEQAEEQMLHIEGVLASEDGSTCLRASRSGPRSEGNRLGSELAEELLLEGGEDLIRNPQEPQQ